MFDHDNSGILSPSECYGALLWLGVPGLTADDVADFIESADSNRDGELNYKEYIETIVGGEADEELTALQEGPEWNDDDEEGGGDVSTHKLRLTDKVNPHGAEELREVMVRRKLEAQAKIKFERLRRNRYLEQLDVEVFEEELKAGAGRQGGVNPWVGAVAHSFRSFTDADREHERAIMVTDFRFETNQTPIRFSPTGKYTFLAIHHGTAFKPKIAPLLCPKGHTVTVTTNYWAAYYTCELCRNKRTQYSCEKCSWFCCSKCFDADRRLKVSDQQNPAKHSTFLRCSQGCSFSLQVPRAGGADPSSGKFTLTLEIRVDKLPPVGQQQALLRLTLPDLSKCSKTHCATLYLSALGDVMPMTSEGDGSTQAQPLSGAALLAMLKANASPERKVPLPQSFDVSVHDHCLTLVKKDSQWFCDGRRLSGGCKGGCTGLSYKKDWLRYRCAKCDFDLCENCSRAYIVGVDLRASETRSVSNQIKKGTKVRAGAWCVVTISVDPEAGSISTYIDGKLCQAVAGLDPAELTLRHKFVVLGGGKAVQSRGGDVRRVLIHSFAAEEESAMKLYYAIADANPAVGGRAIRIQCCYRGHQVRRRERRKKELMEVVRQGTAEGATLELNDSIQFIVAAEVTRDAGWVSGVRASMFQR